MYIAIHGETAAVEMEKAKSAFLELGLVGEVCRSTVAVMQELLRRSPETDLTPYSVSVVREALDLGILGPNAKAICDLTEAVRTKSVTEGVLRRTWDAFGTGGGESAPPISGIAALEN